MQEVEDLPHYVSRRHERRTTRTEATSPPSGGAEGLPPRARSAVPCARGAARQVAWNAAGDTRLPACARAGTRPYEASSRWIVHANPRLPPIPRARSALRGRARVRRLRRLRRRVRLRSRAPTTRAPMPTRDRSLDRPDSEYPTTIVADRHGGVHSGGRWTAWPLDLADVPAQVFDDEPTCRAWWESHRRHPKGVIGIGATPDDALASLRSQLRLGRPRPPEATRRQPPRR